EHLQLDVALRRRDRLAEEHSKRIGFLTRAAPGYPDADRLILWLVAHQFRNDFRRQEIEHLWITEETGDVDQQVLGKKVELVGVASQQTKIPIHFIALDRRQRSTSFDTALQGSRLIERE